jgi:hypothetical protein
MRQRIIMKRHRSRYSGNTFLSSRITVGARVSKRMPGSSFCGAIEGDGGGAD